MRRLLLVLFCLCLTGTTLAGPTLQQKVIPDGEPIPFGKSMELILTLSYPPEFEPPPAESLELPGAHILDRFQVQGPDDGSHRLVHYHVVFTRLEPGAYEIPPLSFGSVSSEPMTVEFSGSTPLDSDEPGEIRAKKPVVELSTADFWKKTLKWSGGILLVLLVLGWLLGRLGILDRLRTPKSRALKGLKRVRKSASDGDQLILGSVEVLRRYLREAYGFVTAEATSKEILNQMTMDNRCRELRNSIQGVLESGDGIKFAKRSLSQPEAADHYDNLIQALKTEPKVKR